MKRVHLIQFLLLWLLSCSQLALAESRVTYFHYDATGTAIMATDEQANVLWKRAPTAYGETPEFHPAMKKYNHRMTVAGHYDDWETGLIYMGKRYYSPKLGRFLTPDPVGVHPHLPQSFNRYGYANNNPYKFVDPDGRAVETALDFVSLGLSINTFRTNPSFANGLGLAYDGLATVVPFLPAGFGVYKAIAKGGDTVSIFKAPAPGKGKHQFENGYLPEDFCTGSQCAFFAKERSLADEWSNVYGEGVIELKIPKSTYDLRLQRHEYPYPDSRGLTELEIPHSEFDVLNSVEKIWHR